MVSDAPHEESEAKAAHRMVESENIEIWRTASEEARITSKQLVSLVNDPGGSLVAGRVALAPDGLSSMTDAHTAWNALQAAPLGQGSGATPYHLASRGPGGAGPSSLHSHQSLGPLQVEDVVIDSSSVPNVPAPPSLSGNLPQPQIGAPAYVAQGSNGFNGTTAQRPGASVQQVDGLPSMTIPSTSLPSFRGSA